MNYPFFSYTRMLAAVALVAGLYLFWPGKLFFLNDDFLHLYLTQQGEWLQQNSVRPVCDLSMWIDYKIWGLHPFGFHLTNTLLHFLNTWLVYRLVLRLLQQYHQSVIAASNAILVATVFFVYAFHAETIFWVIGRSASLATVFFLLSMHAYLYRHKSVKYWVQTLIFFSIGLLTYESVWIFPCCAFIISVLDIRQKKSTVTKEWKLLAGLMLPMVLYMVFRYQVQHNIAGSYEAGKFLEGDATGLSINFIKLFLRSFSRQSGEMYLLVASLLIMFVASISFLLRRSGFAVAILAMFVVSLLPYLSLGIDTFGYEGERYLYLPSVFLSIIVGLGMVNAGLYYKYAVSLIYFFVQVFLLYNARQDYLIASGVTKATVEQFRQLNHKQTIYIRQLPQENNGALIFRSGLNEAQYLYMHAPMPKLMIQSAYEGNYIFFNGTSEQQWSGDLPGKQSSDAVLDYTNNVLTVYR